MEAHLEDMDATRRRLLEDLALEHLGSLAKRPRLLQPQQPQPQQQLVEESATRLTVTCFSKLHCGVYFGGATQACCHQLKLADRLCLALESRGRSHHFKISISFTTPPERDQGREGEGYDEGDKPLQADRGQGGGGRPCRLAEWRRAWGDDVTVGGVLRILPDGKPRLVSECGLVVAVESDGRRREHAWLEVSNMSVGPMPGCGCKVTALTRGSAEVAQASSDGLFLA
ncbi:hypothetical protein PLESTF_000456200 [Pleodorina starrii]|nr:hypothetical protein PLESTF_000456200 [Pleodorina starrii]